MDRRNIHFVKFFIFLSHFFTNVSYATMKNIQMTVGESIPIEFPEGTELKISKKGIIDVFFINDTTWQITALRSGLVIIDAIESETGNPLLPRLFLDIKSLPKSLEASAINHSIPDWVCNKNGITCDRQSGVITGKTADWQWFMRAISWCHTAKHCLSFVELSDTAAVDLQNFLQKKLGPNFTVASETSGSSQISAMCDATTTQQQIDQIEKKLPGILKMQVAYFSCSQNQQTFEVRIKARRISSSEGSTTGFKTNSRIRIDGLPPTPSIDLHNNLVNESLTSSGELIGEPMFMASEDIEFQTLIGGELPFLTQKENSHSYQWKEYGLSVKGKIKGYHAGRIRTHIDIFLKSLNDQSSGSLSSSSLKSSIDSAENVWTLIGELDLFSHSSHRQEAPLFVKLPIIGPFFKLMSTSKDNSKLQVWIQVKSI